MRSQTTAQRALAEDIAERIEGIGVVSVHRFFAGTGLRAEGVQFGFVMKAVLYLRVDDANRTNFLARGCPPFRYSGASGQVTVAAYYEAPSEILDDSEPLSAWAADALRAARSARRGRRARA